MKIAIHAPFGSLSEEAGILMLLAKYLRQTLPEVLQLRCNGAFSLCDRDSETDWMRGKSACFRCMADQRELANWGELRMINLGGHITPDMVRETQLWASFLAPGNLMDASLDGRKIFDLVQGTFRNRFGSEQPDHANHHHEQVLRRLMLSAARAYKAARSCIKTEGLDLLLVAGGDDYISKCVTVAAAEVGARVALFKWDINKRAVMVRHPTKAESIPCELVLEGLGAMRSDIRTWPADLVQIVNNVVNFIGIEAQQVPLAIHQG